eukprot:COSAG02_NODE_985_length_15457_cov_108.738247_7_plen_535_part_00
MHEGANLGGARAVLSLYRTALAVAWRGPTWILAPPMQTYDTVADDEMPPLLHAALGTESSDGAATDDVSVQRSSSGETPGAGGGSSASGATNANDDTLKDSMVICPFLFEDLDSLLTLPGGAPTLYFGAVVATSVAMGLGLLAGTFYTPGLLDAWEAGDLLLALGVGCFAVSTIVLQSLLLVDMRASIRGAAGGGKLPRLGAGTALIPADKEKDLRELMPMAPMKALAVWTILWGFFLFTGWGLQSPTQNRVTSVVAIVYGAFANEHVEKTATVALRTATVLIGARIQAITKAVKLESETAGQDVGPEEWKRTVVGPCRELIGEMRTLSDGWARSIMLGWANQLVQVVACLCFALSPAFAEVLGEGGEHIGAPWLGYAMQGFWFFYAVVALPMEALDIVRAPAEVSTKADTLKETLNDIRISDFSTETHDKIFILECALENCNGGQGLGFCVMGTVIDLKMLDKLMWKLYGALTTMAPLAIAYSTFGAGKAHPPSGDTCALSAVHASTIQAMLSDRNASCVYNMTLESILRGAV